MHPTTLRAITRITTAVAFGLACCALPAHAADKYPAKPIRMIVPHSPGSTADMVARTVAEGLGNRLGQPVYVENNAGAAGIPGTRQLTTAAADGYTIAIVSSNHATNPGLYKHLPYDSIKDITPISVVGTSPMVMVVSGDSPFKTVQDIVAAAKAKPGSISFGSSGKGTILHLAAEMFLAKTGVKMLHVPYRGVNTMMTDLMGGQIQMAFLGIPSALPQIKAGKLLALGVTTPNRAESLPNVPTLAEAGVKDYAYEAWVAMIGPANLPPAITEKLQAEVGKVLATPAAREVFSAQGFVPVGSTPALASQTIKSEIDRSLALIKGASISAE